MPRKRVTVRQLAVLRPFVNLALLIFASLLTGWLLVDARKAERREAEQQEANIAVALERHIERTATTLDLSLRSAITGLASPGLASMPAGTQNAILFDGALTAEGIGGLQVFDDHAELRYSSRPDLARPGSRADRDYFKRHAKDPDLGLLVSGPALGRADGKWGMVLSRRVDHPDGSFAGVVAGTLSLDYVERLLASPSLDPLAVIVLATTEGRLVARRPPAGPDLGRDLGAGPLLARFNVSQAGSFTDMTRLDNAERLVVYRQVGDLPLIIAVGFSTRSIYAGWLRSAELFGLVLVLLGGVNLVLGHALVRELRDRERAERASSLAKAEAERLATELSWSLARHEALVNNSADAMLVARVDRLGVFVYEAVNPVWESFTGITAAAAIGRTPRECLPAAAADVVDAAWDDCVRQRRPVAFSFRFGPDNQQCWDAVVSPVIQDDGAINRVIATARNVTEQRHMEAKLREGNRMEAVAGLTAGMAHDFNNLLQAMLGALEVVSDESGSHADRTVAMGIAAEAGRRAASLVHQLLAFSRNQVLNPVPLALSQLATEIESAVQPMLGSQHRLLTHVADEVGPVLADIAQLNRCLTDLILNARDATPQGGVLMLHVYAADDDEVRAAGLATGSYVRLVVEDEGVGISTEMLPRVFEPFFTTKGIGKGNGLGLSMVQGFARQSGGEVTIESAPGIGTAVCLWLPRALEPLRKTVAATPAIAAPNAGPGGRRILLVDDEPSVRQTLALILRRAGYAAVQAESGEAALALLNQDARFDLLVTDQSMPGITGTDLIEAAAQLRPSLPAILITGFDRVSGAERVAGLVPVLTKPFQRAVFLRQVETLLVAARTLVDAA